MKTVRGSKTFNKFQTTEGTQYFSDDLRKKRQLAHRKLKKGRIPIASVEDK